MRPAVPCIVVGGGVTPDGIHALGDLGAVVVPVSEGPGSVEAAMSAGPGPVERCGERIARLVSLGRAAGLSVSVTWPRTRSVVVD